MVQEREGDEMRTKQVENAIHMHGHQVVIEALRRHHTERMEKFAAIGDLTAVRYSQSFLQLINKFDWATGKVSGREKKQSWNVEVISERFSPAEQLVENARSQAVR
jgi:hypothetical protein